ncbi:hypothetical protein E1757_17425 [Paenibacillus piri]|uniref:Transglutaminase-like domain-containing protein n=2 Tax=Paenibacillus piri TaxID=2547395 RepID=A0A4V2ZTA4_9BACL|nr:hypothetical protein E1757_17425 [Paenibacillus piri]
MTLCYLTLLQLIFDLDMSDALLRSAGAGLLLLSSLQTERWLRWRQEPSEHAFMPAVARGLLFRASRFAAGSSADAAERRTAALTGSRRRLGAAGAQAASLPVGQHRTGAAGSQAASYAAGHRYGGAAGAQAVSYTAGHCYGGAIAVQTAAHGSRRHVTAAGMQAASQAPGHRRSRAAASLAGGLAVAALCLLGASIGAAQHSQPSKQVDWSGFIAAAERLVPSSAWNAFSMPGGGRLASVKAKTGYGTDDSQLGFPLEPDDQLAFTAYTTQLTYWRGETKNVYTGHGWSQSYSPSVQNINDAAMTASDASAAQTEFSSGAAKTMVRQQIMLKQSGLGGQLFLGGDIMKVEAMVSLKGEAISTEWLWRGKLTDRVILPVLTDPLDSYKVQVLAWNQSAPTDGSTAAYAFPHDIEDAYLQLPDKLPARVGELADKLTEGLASPYDKVKAIERYLRTSYIYSMEQSKPPSDGQDFVDQFLFVQKAGYCDHFSTAMAVMLRSIGIPSRWAKGFGPGEITAAKPANGAVDDPAAVEYTVEVRNKDAHSWVEVYFPSSGWVPFDPTPGYAGVNALSSQAAIDAAALPHGADGQQADTVTQPSPDHRPEPSFVLSMERVIPMLAEFAEALSTYVSAIGRLFHSFDLWAGRKLALSLWIMMAAILLLLVHMWIKRKRSIGASDDPPASVPGRGVGAGAVSSRIVIHATESLRSWQTIRLSERIWGKLQKRWGRSGPAQTMREYLLTRPFSTDEQRSALLHLVRLLEAIRYHRGPGRVTHSQLYAAWRELKRASGAGGNRNQAVNPADHL